jgi:cbb3-type cytochrome oxidase subunit 1
MVAPFMLMRAFSGLLIVLGQVLFAYNVVKTLVFAEASVEGPLEEPAGIAPQPQTARVQN